MPVLPGFNEVRGREFFIRMLLSALADADYCDTEAWLNPEASGARPSDRRLPSAAIPLAPAASPAAAPIPDCTRARRLTCVLPRPA